MNFLTAILFGLCLTASGANLAFAERSTDDEEFIQLIQSIGNDHLRDDTKYMPGYCNRNVYLWLRKIESSLTFAQRKVWDSGAVHVLMFWPPKGYPLAGFSGEFTTAHAYQKSQIPEFWPFHFVLEWQGQVFDLDFVELGNVLGNSWYLRYLEYLYVKERETMPHSATPSLNPFRKIVPTSVADYLRAQFQRPISREGIEYWSDTLNFFRVAEVTSTQYLKIYDTEKSVPNAVAAAGRPTSFGTFLERTHCANSLVR